MQNSDQNQRAYYRAWLHGLTDEMPEEFVKLAQLLEVNQLEFLPHEDGLRLVYLMNDAVESFLLFKDARTTGHYIEEYEGETYASIQMEGDQYILIIYQGDESIFTIFFKELELQVFCYNYGEVGHFWVEGYEYLRQLEYRLAILRDKVEYIGKVYCTSMEEKLSVLTEFPPLNYCCYPSVSEQYLVTHHEPWSVSQKAIERMKSLSVQVGDQKLERALRIYQKYQGKFVARWIAKLLRENAHAKVIDLLIETLKEETKQYPDRSFGKEKDEECRRLMEQAHRRQAELRVQGKESMIVREEPFACAQDSVEYKVYVMIWKKEKKNRTVEIEQIME